VDVDPAKPAQGVDGRQLAKYVLVGAAIQILDPRYSASIKLKNGIYPNVTDCSFLMCRTEIDSLLQKLHTYVCI
jgi:hypothetical protein